MYDKAWYNAGNALKDLGLKAFSAVFWLNSVRSNAMRNEAWNNICVNGILFGDYFLVCNAFYGLVVSNPFEINPLLLNLVYKLFDFEVFRRIFCIICIDKSFIDSVLWRRFLRDDEISSKLVKMLEKCGVSLP